MAEASVMINWGRSETGREMMGINVFREALTYWEKQKSSGNIEDYKVGLTQMGDLGMHAGYAVLEGSNAQISKMMDDEQFQTLVMKATHVVQTMNVHRCATGTAIPQRIEKLVAIRNGLGIK